MYMGLFLQGVNMKKKKLAIILLYFFTHTFLIQANCNKEVEKFIIERKGVKHISLQIDGKGIFNIQSKLDAIVNANANISEIHLKLKKHTKLQKSLLLFLSSISSSLTSGCKIVIETDDEDDEDSEENHRHHDKNNCDDTCSSYSDSGGGGGPGPP
jgi:hypothetical protein